MVCYRESASSYWLLPIYLILHLGRLLDLFSAISVSGPNRSSPELFLSARPPEDDLREAAMRQEAYLESVSGKELGKVRQFKERAKSAK
jgi:hypothetical protein